MRIFIFLLLFIPMFIFSQEGQSFHLKDVVFLKENSEDKIHGFLKSRYFDFVEIDSTNMTYTYALNYDRNTERASTWCYKYFDGRLKVEEMNEGNLLLNIKSQLKKYKVDFTYQPDGWIMTEFYYGQYVIAIRENDVIDEYELYIENKL